MRAARFGPASGGSGAAIFGVVKGRQRSSVGGQIEEEVLGRGAQEMEAVAPVGRDPCSAPPTPPSVAIFQISTFTRYLEYTDRVRTSVLEEHGIALVPVDGEHVRLEHQDHSAVFFVLTIPRLARTHDIRPAPERHALLIADAITSEASERAWASGWSVVTEDGAGWVRFAGRTLRFEPTTTSHRRPKRPRGRPGRGVFSVVRALFAIEGGALQAEIAEVSHVGQAAVSKSLNRLADLDLVARGTRGWEVTDRAGAASWWLANYPGPGGIETHWFGVESIGDQAYRAYAALDRVEHARPVMSGDVVADIVVPWRTPRRATLYAQRGVDLSEVGLTPSDASAETLTLVLPQDAGVWPISKAPVLIEMGGHGDFARANAFQVLYDLSRSPGPDADEALQAWRDWMVESGQVL
jgi:hypothetical protein